MAEGRVRGPVHIALRGSLGMMKRAPKRLRDRARNLRKVLTISERRLWNWLRNRTFAGFKFRRQFPLDHFVLDFYCPELALAIEVDGRQHEQQPIADCDSYRTERLCALGVRVERIPNALMAKDPMLVEEQIRYWIMRRAAER